MTRKIKSMERHLENMIKEHRDIDHKIGAFNYDDQELKKMKMERLKLKRTIDWFQSEMVKIAAPANI